MHKFISNFLHTKFLRLIFVWAIFISFSGLIFSTNIITTPAGLALAPSQAHAGDLCSATMGFGILECITKVVLFSPAQLFSIGIGFAVSLIAYATDPNVFNKLFELQAVYTAWGVVRDIFNVIFIFVLLFSAFATIFRVQKYHLKNILLMVILMALLVNFSWPLAGLIIDFSNVLMLFFLGDQTGISLSSAIGDNSSFAENILLEGADEKATIQDNGYSALIMVSIFTFIFMITMLAVAFQLFIRTIALLVLLIFSPIGIAGAAIPKMQGLSKMWWESFTRYAFTGPIAVFMLVFAVAIMQDFIVSDLNANLSGNAGSTGAPWGSGLLTNIQKFIIPMVILWVGVVASSKLSDVGSKFVTSRARSFGAATGKRIGRFGIGAARGAGRGGVGTARLLDRGVGALTGGATVESTVSGKFRGIGEQYKNIKTTGEKRRQAASDLSKAHKVENAWIGGDPMAVKKETRKQIGEREKLIRESQLKTPDLVNQYNELDKNDVIARGAYEKYFGSKDAVKSPDDLKAVLGALKPNLSSSNEDVRKDALKTSKSAIRALDTDGFEDFTTDQYADIRKSIEGSTSGDKALELLDTQLVAKKRFDIKTEYEIQNDGDPTAVIDKLSVTQIAESEALANVLSRNQDKHQDQVRELALAVQKKINATSKSKEQFQVRTNSTVEGLYREAITNLASSNNV